MEPSPEHTLKELRWIRLLLIVIALPLCVLILKELRAMFIPLIFAAFLSFLFAPMLKALAKRKVPIFVGIILVLVILITFIAMVGGVFYATYTSFINQLPKYQDKFSQMIESNYLWFEQQAARMDLAFEKLPLLKGEELFPAGSFSLNKLLSGTMNFFGNLGTYLFLTLIFMIFIITGGVKFEKRMKKALGESGKIKAFATLLNIQIQIQRYFVNKSIISAGTSLCGMLILAILQVDFIIISGTLLFALNFIPNIGSVIASLFPILICLVDFGLGWRVILVAVMMILNQVVFANILEPKFMGERLNLSPLVVLIALVFWGWVWGIIGMMIAVPLTSAINIVLKQVDKDNIVSAIISDE